MPPKRRGAQAKSANLATNAAPPEQSKPPSSSKPAPTSAPAPVPPPPPPPPLQPLETGATRVRKEWTKFTDAWYEPQKKKFVEKLQKDLLIKYKSLGSAKETQKLREMELFERLDSIAQQLAQPARAEWERRLELAQLREEQWDDMSGEEQHAVMSVFVGFFADDVEDMDDDVSADPSSIEEEESAVEEPQYRGSYPPSRQPVPPTPIRGNFEFVNPTSFIAENTTPPNPSKNLPALSMDHLATLGPSNAVRSTGPAGPNLGGMLSFQNWASEAGIVTQSPPQSLTARPRATDNMSRQASATSNLSSPPFKTSSPQSSPPHLATKFSPPINAENLALGKRYIGPVIMEEEPDPMDEELLKSKMADEYQQYKISLRIQMIYQFHAEAADFEIKLFETLLADDGTKESRARAVQDHETSMMRLREQKEEERKKLCAQEREKRREEIRRHLAQRRSAQNQEVDPGAKTTPPKSLPDKTPRSRKVTHQNEKVPLSQPAAATSTKLEPPSVLKKSISGLSQDEVHANEAFFANAMAMMSQGKAGTAGFTPAQASQNEALFSNVAATLAAQGQPGSSGKSTLHPPNMKKSSSSRSQDHDLPQITISLADSPTVAPEPAQVPPTVARGKKGKKGQPAAQPPPAKPVAITEEPEREMDAEPPPPASFLWDAPTVIAKNAWGAASISASKHKLNASVEEELDLGLTSATLPVSASERNANTRKTVSAAKKGKKVTITEELDVDAEPTVSPPPPPSCLKTKATKGGWGSVNGKSKVTPLFAEESEPEPAAPPPPVTPAWGKKTGQAATKSTAKAPQKVAVWEEQESEAEQSFAHSRKNKAKSAWGVPSATPSASTGVQTGKKATQQQQQQVEARWGATSSGSRSARVDAIPDAEDESPEMAGSDSAMPGALEFVASEEASEEGDANAWPNPEDIDYWANFMGGQTEAGPETIPQTAAQSGKHVRWTPIPSVESEDDEFGEADEDLETNMWMQYAISGGDIPSSGGALQEPQLTPSESAQHDTNLWEQGKGKKKLNATVGDFGNRAQQTSVFDRAAITGQWPKMESWLSPPSRGQNSGSTRVF